LIDDLKIHLLRSLLRIKRSIEENPLMKRGSIRPCTPLPLEELLLTKSILMKLLLVIKFFLDFLQERIERIQMKIRT